MAGRSSAAALTSGTPVEAGAVGHCSAARLLA